MEPLEDRYLLDAYVWTGADPKSSYWTASDNWTVYGVVPNRIPDYRDDVFFNSNNAPASVMDQSFTIGDLIFSGNQSLTLSVDAKLTLTGTTSTYGRDSSFTGKLAVSNLGGLELAKAAVFSWNYGTITTSDTYGNFTVDAGATLNINGGVSTLDNSLFLFNYGTMNWQGPFIVLNKSWIDNKSGSQFNVNSKAQVMKYGGTATTDSFHVESGATFTQSDATTTGNFKVDFQVDFRNDGSVNVNQGGLILSTKSTSSGTYTVAAGTRQVACYLEIDTKDNSKPSQLNSATFTGAGTVHFILGDIQLTGTTKINNYKQSPSANFKGSGRLQVQGKGEWQGGIWLGSGIIQVVSGGELDITAIATAGISMGMILDNNGSVVWTGPTDIRVTNGANINNNSGALFDIRVDQKLLNSGGGTFYNNSGSTLQKSVGTGNAEIDIATGPNGGSILDWIGRLRFLALLDNQGTISVSGSGMDFLAGFEQDSGSTTLSGTSPSITVPAGNLVQKGGTITVQASGSRISVIGQYQQSGGTTTVDNFASISVTDQYVESGGTVELQSGSITATNGFQVLSGALLRGLGSITASTLTNSGTIEPGDIGGTGGLGGISITGNYTQTSGGVLNEDMYWSGSSMYSDHLSCSGQASLHGTLNVTLLQSPPPIHVSDNLIGWGSLVGTFDTANIPAGWQLIYNPTYLEILKVS